METLKHYTISVYNPGSVCLMEGIKMAAILTERYDDKIPGQFTVSIVSMNSLNTGVRDRNFLPKRIHIDSDFSHDRLMPSAWNAEMLESWNSGYQLRKSITFGSGSLSLS